MIRLIGLMVKLPSSLLISTIEAFLRSILRAQDVFEQNVDAITGELARTVGGTPAEVIAPAPSTRPDPPPTVAPPGVPAPTRPSIPTAPPTPIEQEARRVRDKDLSGDDLKLVKYKILFVKRDFEAVLYHDEELVSDQMDEAGLAAWKTAEFIQAIERQPDPDIRVRIPASWKDNGAVRYPINTKDRTFIRKIDGKDCVIGIPHEDKKFLRVYFEVEERYPREEAVYDRDQARALQGIQTLMQKSKMFGGGNGNGGANAPANGGANAPANGGGAGDYDEE